MRFKDTLQSLLRHIDDPYQHTYILCYMVGMNIKIHEQRTKFNMKIWRAVIIILLVSQKFVNSIINFQNGGNFLINSITVIIYVEFVATDLIISKMIPTYLMEL